jgi:hypothetical protein
MSKRGGSCKNTHEHSDTEFGILFKESRLPPNTGASSSTTYAKKRPLLNSKYVGEHKRDFLELGKRAKEETVFFQKLDAKRLKKKQKRKNTNDNRRKKREMKEEEKEQKEPTKYVFDFSK